MNSAVWFGAAVFFLLGAGPAAHSQAVRDVLAAKGSPYYPIAVAHIIASSYWHLHLVCSIVAVVQVLAEWLYLGRYLRRFWFWLLAGLVAAGLFAVYGVQPQLKQKHLTAYSGNLRMELRVAAARSYRVWAGVEFTLDVLVTVGAALYFWRIANPPDPTRFVSATKFRS